MPPDVRARGDALDGVADVLGQLLLGAHDRAGGGLGRGHELVDVDADAVDARLAGGLEHAVAGLARDLEHDVDLGVLGQQLLGDGLAARPGR